MIMLEHLVELDKDLFLFLNSLGSSRWDGFWLFVTNKFSAIPIYAILLFLTYRALGLRRTIIAVLAVGLMILVTDQLSNFFKYGVQRLRPCHDPTLQDLVRLVKKSCGGKYSYFSAHAGNNFALAFFFSSLLKTKYRYIGILLAFWAVLVSYSRIYIGVHFPLDIITGALIGLIFSWLFLKLAIFADLKIPL